ncbi:hypothetical protein QCA50_014237 [Cerrena zonata]|uniref:Uncharacterized protein n=1 Tax=Cerrena zonata TaxID=2478898 RepID=A0AAW0FRY8_9APHY
MGEKDRTCVEAVMDDEQNVRVRGIRELTGQVRGGRARATPQPRRMGVIDLPRTDKA